MIVKMDVRIFVLAIFFMSDVSAYEIATHGVITQKAYQRSVLLYDAQLLADFGLSDRVDNIGGYTYYDISGSEIQARYGKVFEKNIIETVDKSVNVYSIQGWLMRGAIREDDCSIPYFCDNPGDDPTGATRPFNHFFDPVNNEKLWLGEYTAPNWTLGTLNAFPIDGEMIQPLPNNLFKTNHFTMFDAREAQYRALTGHVKEGTKDIVLSGTSATEPQIRAAYWVTMFRIVGNSVKSNGGHKHA